MLPIGRSWQQCRARGDRRARSTASAYAERGDGLCVRHQEDIGDRIDQYRDGWCHEACVFEAVGP